MFNESASSRSPCPPPPQIVNLEARHRANAEAIEREAIEREARERSERRATGDLSSRSSSSDGGGGESDDDGRAVETPGERMGRLRDNRGDEEVD